jgi:uncharacterized protein YggL (DUF469 family)
LGLVAEPWCKRLRRKLRFGGFRESGLEVSYELRPGVTENEAEALLDLFIEQIQANGLSCGKGARTPRGAFW